MKIKVLSPLANPSTITPTNNLTDNPKARNSLILVSFYNNSPIRCKKLPIKNQIQM